MRPAMRVAVVDIGTNSTRLLVADVEDGRVVDQLDKRSEVTRLGEGVDAGGRLGDAPMERVFGVLETYGRKADELGADARIGVLTSAVRDADNGAEFTAAVRERFGFDARTIAGDTEAELTFAGATSERDPADETQLVVVDIGGGSTELVQGAGGKMDFHVSTQAGVVRQSERHLHTDPPTPAEIEALAVEVRGIVLDNVSEEVLDAVGAGIGVAGTATSAAAIAQALEPYDPEKVEGYVLERPELDRLLAMLAALPLAERRAVPGLHPDRAPTIVAGIVILQQVLDSFALDRIEVSERDILQGAAIAFSQRSKNKP
jgi:exopolyphosphatase/guanosine-5'-triphosphate,3'-diphosphate pyrophosphatase